MIFGFVYIEYHFFFSILKCINRNKKRNVVKCNLGDKSAERDRDIFYVIYDLFIYWLDFRDGKWL